MSYMGKNKYLFPDFTLGRMVKETFARGLKIMSQK